MPPLRLVLAASLLAACARAPSPEPCVLPALSAAQQLSRGLYDVPIFTLPDSGGIFANGARIPSSQVAMIVGEILAPRPSPTKVIFVERVSAGRCGDLRALVQATEAAGGAAFDALGSHRALPRPRPVPGTE